jgi:hypothetical protein
MAHLIDDETVAKMGHPNLDVGHPAFGTIIYSTILVLLVFSYIEIP